MTGEQLRSALWDALRLALPASFVAVDKGSRGRRYYSATVCLPDGTQIWCGADNRGSRTMVEATIRKSDLASLRTSLASPVNAAAKAVALIEDAAEAVRAAKTEKQRQLMQTARARSLSIMTDGKVLVAAYVDGFSIDAMRLRFNEEQVRTTIDLWREWGLV